VAFGIIIPSIAEELGWRGFSLSHLQQRHGPVIASLILGTPQGLWHLPALMTLNFGPLHLANYVPFMLTAALAAVIYTWVYNHTGGSVLLAILLHAASNAISGWLGALLTETGLQSRRRAWRASSHQQARSTGSLAYGLVALLLVVTTRGRLGYRPAAGLSASVETREGQQ
jgi:uncharacterized protein